MMMLDSKMRLLQSLKAKATISDDDFRSVQKKQDSGRFS
jgi:hypothetical protein